MFPCRYGDVNRHCWCKPHHSDQSSYVVTSVLGSLKTCAYNPGMQAIGFWSPNCILPILLLFVTHKYKTSFHWYTNSIAIYLCHMWACIFVCFFQLLYYVSDFMICSPKSQVRMTSVTWNWTPLYTCYTPCPTQPMKCKMKRRNGTISLATVLNATPSLFRVFVS